MLLVQEETSRSVTMYSTCKLENTEFPGLKEIKGKKVKQCCKSHLTLLILQQTNLFSSVCFN